MNLPPILRPDAAILERNLTALAKASPMTARRVREGLSADDIRLWAAPDGGVTGEYRGTRLASFHRPREEGKRLVHSAPVEKVAGFVVNGFGLGHHVGAIAARVRRAGVVIVFEPDTQLLRSVLERVDISGLFTATNLVVLTSEHDAAAIAQAAHGVEGLLATGVTIIEHPASRARLRGRSEIFGKRFAEVMRAVRTTVMTTLVQVNTTVRNLLGNIEGYARALPLKEIAGLHAGRAAVVVAAGPSLKRNIGLLARPEIRERVVVVAVQTVLKTLLSRGIKPDYVTALDYAELSRRFYEGLTAKDVEGVELVVEPKAHPSILESYPGVIRCPAERFLDDLFGPTLTRDMGSLRPGATVAHMAYYLARHLGCDPVVLIGQDLGFTDGQYYYSGAAIHQVWSGELNTFNSLEMLEWERIVRSRSLLHKATDVLGRPVYTDEQMTTYLAQFERDFLADSQQANRTIIDATEGGVSKRHTTAMTLREAIDRCPARTSNVHARPRAGARIDVNSELLHARVREVRQQVANVERISRETVQTLERMRSLAGNAEKINSLVGDVYSKRDEVMRNAAGYKIVEFLNQTGVFNRFKADRAIEMEPGLTPAQLQQRQIERDITNVTWVADAAEEMESMFGEACAKLEGSPGKIAPPSEKRSGGVRITREDKRIGAIVLLDHERGGLGLKRDALAPVIEGSSLLSLTMERLARVRALDEAIILCSDSLPAAELVEFERKGVKIVRRPAREWRARAESVGAARVFSRRAWRSGPGFMSVFDEVCAPAPMAAIANQFGLDACLLLGADWSLFDPELASKVISRYRESEVALKFVFSHGAPGLSPCLVERGILEEFVAQGARAGPFASLGAMLGYIPIAPLADPIAKPCCVTVPPDVRDLGERCIADSVGGLRTLLPLLKKAARGESIDAERVARELRCTPAPGSPELVKIELVADPDHGPAWRRPEAGGHMSDALARLLIERLRGFGPSTAVSFEGRGDALSHPRWREIISHAMESGFAGVHVRTDLSGHGEIPETLLTLGVPMVSVDLWANSPATYEVITGAPGFDDAVAGVRRLIAKRGERSGLPAMWVFPRLTRCDAVYAEVEHFYDRWRMEAGASVIDPLPFALADQRITPFPVPPGVLERERNTVMRVRFDGSAALDPAEPLAGANAGNLANIEAGAAWDRQKQAWQGSQAMRAAS